MTTTTVVDEHRLDITAAPGHQLDASCSCGQFTESDLTYLEGDEARIRYLHALHVHRATGCRSGLVTVGTVSFPVRGTLAEICQTVERAVTDQRPSWPHGVYETLESATWTGRPHLTS